ncbi:hypothetical protein ACQJBY_062208 [Aegilops geniculata]
MAQPALPDELLEEIFLRLPTAADLARASAACSSFRRVVAGHPFLRRFRVLHPPPLLGILCWDLTPAQPPHPSAAAAATLAGADFSCPFLPPSPDRWYRRDVLDGRALFSPRFKAGGHSRNSMHRPSDLVTEFAVCDPLHRRYLLLPALADHLADLVHQPDIVECEPFLAPPGDGEDSSFRDFRVMCLVRCTTKLVLFVFSSCAGQWLADPITFDVFGRVAALRRYYAHGCFCWQIYDGADMLVLDTRRMEFSTVDLPPPPGSYMRDMAIVEAEEGRFGMFTISDRIKRGVYHLLYATRRKDGNVENQWQPKPPISLPESYRYCIKGVAGGYLLLTGYPKEDRPTVDYFSLNLQTFQVEWFCQTGDYVMIGHLYADLPPSLSPPTL